MLPCQLRITPKSDTAVSQPRILTWHLLPEAPFASAIGLHATPKDPGAHPTQPVSAWDASLGSCGAVNAKLLSLATPEARRVLSLAAVSRCPEETFLTLTLTSPLP